MPADYYIRPMRPDDVPAVERLTAEGFYDIDVRTRRPGWPEPTMRPGAKADSWRRRMHHLLAQDPGGCWVADDDTGVIGVAVALKRDLTWILATFVVRPGLQGRGVGRQLLDAALSYGDGCLRGMLAASEDPKAARRYRLADFTLHPAMSCRRPSAPQNSITPPGSGRSARSSSFATVVLPEPDSPTTATVLPRSSTMPKSASACTGCPALPKPRRRPG